MAERPDDAQLVALALRDPAAGWAAIWDAHGDALHAYCVRLLDDRSEADDAVSDVFLVASQRLEGLRDPSALRAWLYAIVRRRVQQRWRQRSRTVPVDPHGAVVTGQTTVDVDHAGRGDAAELVAAAAAGLSVADRELLALTLGADLDTSEVARITGESISAISVRVTRLKDTVGRAAGALLVARHHRTDCGDLTAVLGDWDGTFDTVWRKRIARHVDGCAVCEDRRSASVSVFAAPLLLAPAGPGLRDRVLERISHVAGVGVAGSASAPVVGAGASRVPDLGPYDRAGFPTPQDWRRRRPLAWWWVAAAALAIVVGITGMVLVDDDPAAVTAVAPSVTTTVVPRPATTTPVPTTSTPATSTPSSSSTTTPSRPTPTTAPPAQPTPTTTPTTRPVPTPTPPTTVAPDPTVVLRVAPADLAIAPGKSERATATIVVGGGTGAVTTVISWDGPDAGSTMVAGPGTQRTAIGPFRPPSPTTGPSTVTVTATVTDGVGRTATATTTFTVSALQ